MKATRETALVHACRQLLTLRGVFHWRQNSGATVFGQGPTRRFVRSASINGISDLLAVLPDHCHYPGRLLAVECKSPTGRRSKAQAWFQDQVTEAGGFALLVRDVAELNEFLDCLGV